MSRFFSATATCLGCGKAARADFPASINADRRPDLRISILDGTLFRRDCEGCGRLLGFEPQLTYLDIGRGQWILAHESEQADQWQEHEAEALAIYDRSFGAGAAPAARALRPATARMVFGWPALAEKILCQELGVSDVSLEVAKLAVIREQLLPAMDTRLDLRLVHRDGRMLCFGVVDPAMDTPLRAAEVGQDLLDAIEADPARWAPITKLVAGSLYVDIGRVLHGVPPE